MNRASTLLRTAIIGQVPKRCKAYLGELKGTMNDLPKPGGCWKTQYEARQRKNNAQLVIGISFFLLTLGFGQSLGLFFLNGTIPDHPAPKIDYSK